MYIHSPWCVPTTPTDQDAILKKAIDNAVKFLLVSWKKNQFQWTRKPSQEIELWVLQVVYQKFYLWEFSDDLLCGENDSSLRYWNVRKCTKMSVEWKESQRHTGILWCVFLDRSWQDNNSTCIELILLINDAELTIQKFPLHKMLRNISYSGHISMQFCCREPHQPN